MPERGWGICPLIVDDRDARIFANTGLGRGRGQQGGRGAYRFAAQGCPVGGLGGHLFMAELPCLFAE